MKSIAVEEELCLVECVDVAAKGAALAQGESSHCLVECHCQVASGDRWGRRRKLASLNGCRGDGGAAVTRGKEWDRDRDVTGSMVLPCRKGQGIAAGSTNALHDGLGVDISIE